ncbi:MAG: fluoride efflux transporter CrcB [Magnetococcales bacterium]|nr:fluoride efflux transporter CrcB [Magnetococcales bacterium]
MENHASQGGRGLECPVSGRTDRSFPPCSRPIRTLIFRRGVNVEALPVVAVGLGAAFGAWLRWWLGMLLNPVFPTVPLGTLAANLLGGYLVGVAVAYFSHHTALPPEARLFLITGFLGGLTTFSTFSAEVVGLLMHQEYGWALLTAGGHLLGSLTMTALGIFTLKALSA